MNVIKKAKRRYASRGWIKAHSRVYRKLLYNSRDVNKLLEMTAGYKERQRKIWRDLSKRKRGIITD